MSSKHGRELRAAVIADLQRAGIKPGRLTGGGKHSRLPVVVNGVGHKITLPRSPSDVRAKQNAVHQVRRMLKEWMQ
jgi:hypothetical protein